jgi:hypothetical protein
MSQSQQRAQQQQVLVRMQQWERLVGLWRE